MRQWNTRVLLSFVTASSVAFFSVIAWTNFEPLSGILRALVVIAVLSALIAGPLLAYFGASKNKPKWSSIGVMLPILFSTLSVIVYYNGLNDSTPVTFREASIHALETGSTTTQKVFKVYVRLNHAPHSKVTVWTTRDRFEQLAPGMVIGLPSKAGALGIPWRVKHEPIRLIRK